MIRNCFFGFVALLATAGTFTGTTALLTSSFAAPTAQIA
jgi:hypothetical protein